MVRRIISEKQKQTLQELTILKQLISVLVKKGIITKDELEK